jgi:hypothetical protein
VSQDRPEWIIPLDLPPSQVGLLQGILTACLDGLERDLQREETLLDPQATRCETDACARLLEGLERAIVAGPDEDAYNVLTFLLFAADVSNAYPAVVAEHGALDELRSQISARVTKATRHSSDDVRHYLPRVDSREILNASSIKQEDNQLQRAVFELLLHEHPTTLTLIEIADRLFNSYSDPRAGAPLAVAVRELAIGGLVKSQGPLVVLTKPALHVKELERCE